MSNSPTFNLIGQPLPRADGRSKVTGIATFTAEHQLPGVVHGQFIGSRVACGRIRAIDTRAAMALSGVLDVITPETAPRIRPLPE